MLPTWDEALDTDEAAEPLHVIRFGVQVDGQGVLAGTPDANVPPLAVRLLRTVAERQRWRAHMAQLEAQAQGQDPSATEGMSHASRRAD